MIVFFILLLTSSLAFTQPYEPIILLDVTGEPAEAIGSGILHPVGDQDGDGKDDILTIAGVSEGGSVLRIYYGVDDNQPRLLQFGRMDSSVYNMHWISSAETVPAGDVNGDGHKDILLDICKWVGHCEIWPALFFGGPGVFDTIPDWIGDSTRVQFTTNVGDYDGDGRDDVTRRPLNGNAFGFYRSGDPMPSTPTWTHIPNRDHMGFGDFNGDGFSDFGMSYLTVSTSVSQVDLFLGSEEANSLPGFIHQYGPAQGEANERFRFVGDINGDGFDDLVSDFRSFWTGNQKQLYYGGDPFDFEADGVFHHEPIEGIPQWQIGLGDINRDDYDDFAIYGVPDEPGPEGIEIYLGGDPPTLEPVWSLASPFEGMVTPYRIGPAGDFNGDGIDDWVFSCYEGVERRGRIIVIAGDDQFGQAVGNSPDFHPSSFILHPCFPNPFNSTVTIPFEITGSRMQTVAFTIFNTLGQTVYSYPMQTYMPGTHRLTWDGHNTSCSQSSGGVYFLVAATAMSKQTMKLVFIP